MTRRALLVAGLAVVLAGCGSIDLDREPPLDFDLSGDWRLVAERSDTPPTRRLLRARGGLLSFITQDFPGLRAEHMRIEQHADSMGIAYDGGDYRDVSWGRRQRGLWDVRAGWHEGRLMILFEADDADAREVLTLAPDGRELTLDILVRAGGDDLQATRVFQREGS